MTKEFENEYQYKKILRPVAETSDFKNSYIVGDACCKIYLYKYYNMDVASSVIQDGFLTFRFQQPSQWSDKFETLFYNADYSNDFGNSSRGLRLCYLERRQRRQSAHRHRHREHHLHGNIRCIAHNFSSFCR